MLKHRIVLTTAVVLSLTASAFADTPSPENYPEPKNNTYWWPKQLDLSALRQNQRAADPRGEHFNYAESFKQLDLNALIADLKQLMTNSQPWWPADYGHYGPLFIRMSWHAAGTYRIYDGRGGAGGGQQRFAPLNSWPDNANLDKARRLLWPIKQKYGDKISWADLLVLAGNVAMEDMGFKTIGFAGGRMDDWEPEQINWGMEEKWLTTSKNRVTKDGKLKQPFGATVMGLIYVNPEGPDGVPDPLKAAQAIRQTFGNMAMNDEETVALIAGGHAFGKVHGAASTHYLGNAPEGAPIQAQGFGWENHYKSGKGEDTITSGLEGAWTVTPVKWSHNYLQNLFAFEWEQTKSPAGATQWKPANKGTQAMIPDAFDSKKRHSPMMLTTDLALKFDPIYRQIAERFRDNPDALEKAFANAWFKLIHRDMGPRSRYLGPFVPKESFIWQDPVPAVDYELVNAQDVVQLKKDILDSGLTVPQLVRTAWASASVYRNTDKRGGANGARIRLAPQNNWPVNQPQALNTVLRKLEDIQKTFNDAQKGNKKISLADLIVLGGDAAIEKAAKDAGLTVDVPFAPGRTDATVAQTDAKSFEVLEPRADGFRNYYPKDNPTSAPQMLVDKAYMLNLTVPEMTVLVGGMRALNANYDGNAYGVFTDKPGTLSNDFFINLLSMQYEWKPSESEPGIYEGYDRQTGQIQWKGTAVDLIFGRNAELRAVAELYASSDSKQRFADDFVKAWVKVMRLDRFDLPEKEKDR